MVAAQTKKDHNYIKERVEKYGSLEEYLSNISSNTIKNYKKKINDYIEANIKSSVERIFLKKLVVGKTKKGGLKDISRAVELILDNIDKSSAKHDLIIIQDDYDFLLVVLLIHINNKEKTIFSVKDIVKMKKELIFEVVFSNTSRKEFVIIHRKKLFEKLFKTIKNHREYESLFKMKNFTKIIEIQFSRADILKEYDKSLFKRYIATKYISLIM